MTSAGIVGLGLWVPDQVRRNDAWSPEFVRAFHERREERRSRDFTDVERRATERPYESLYVRHSTPYENDPFKGAVVRHVTSPEVPTAEGDATAAMRALEEAGVDPKDVDLVVSSALVPDRLVPSNGPDIQRRLGCVNAAAIGVESYCSAAISQLELAAGLVEAGRARFVLCVQSHQIARANDLDLPASPIFGDAAGAFVVGRVPEGRGLVRVVRGGDGALAGAVTWNYRNTPGAPWWRDAQGAVSPGSDDIEAARVVTANALSYAIDTVNQLCREVPIPLDAVAAFATIQPLAWYQAAVAEGLGVPVQRLPSTYARIAHVGGVGPVANLLEARRLGLLRDKAPVVMFAIGAGLTKYAALVRWWDRGEESFSS